MTHQPGHRRAVNRPLGVIVISAYAWRIDEDHLDSEPPNAVGVAGPRDARLDDQGNPTGYAHHHQFRMYDDDNILYVTGTLFWDGESEPEEEFAYAPLRDYGTPGLGCVLVRYTGQPHWDCG